MNILNRMKINAKILSAVILVVIMASALAFLSVFYLNQMNNRLNYLVDISAEKVRLAGVLNQTILEVVRAEKNYILAEDDTERSDYSVRTNALINDVEDIVATIAPLVDEDGQVILQSFNTHWQTYLQYNIEIRRIAGQNNIQEAANISQKEGRTAINLCMDDLRALVEKNDFDMAADKKISDANFQKALTWTISLALVALLIGTTSGIAVSRNIAASLNEMVLVANEISRGNVQHKLNTNNLDETGDLARAFTRTIDYLREVTTVADAIANGDLTVQVEPRSEQDTLNQAIRQMVQSLNKVTEENSRRIWLASGQSELTDQTRGQMDIVELGRRVITFLCRYLEAPIGALYRHEDQKLTLSASYAYTHRKNLSDQFQIGDGIVGQAALEKQMILISEVPDDYIRVQSGLGDAPPVICWPSPFYSITPSAG